MHLLWLCPADFGWLAYRSFVTVNFAEAKIRRQEPVRRGISVHIERSHRKYGLPVVEEFLGARQARLLWEKGQRCRFQ